ncbi:MAG: WD40 repeat domain-containing protein [Gemmataceae bacterium]|nr:WD40 repeat domain-containing protein [Gemmataceae bacterium]
MTLRLDTWKGIEVAPSSHDITIIKPHSTEADLPSGPNLIATFPFTDKAATTWAIKFSPDGRRLFTSGYPSGVVQFWDVDTGKEIRRFATMPGYRSNADYASLSSDWKTMYVAEHQTEHRRIQVDRKSTLRFEYSGRVRVWDVATGIEQASIPPSPDTGPTYVEISPNGRHLLTIEEHSHNSGSRMVPYQTMVTDLKTGEKWKLTDSNSPWKFSGDGNRVTVTVEGHGPVLPSVFLHDLTTRSRVADAYSPERESSYLIKAVDPSDKFLAISQPGVKGKAREHVILDAATLQERGRFLLSNDPKIYGLSGCCFTPDSCRFIATDSGSNLYVWNVANAKLERTVVQSVPRRALTLAVSPDSRYAAIGWSPPVDPQIDNLKEPELADMPRPRITVVDLTGQTPNREFVTPAGFGVRVCFSPDGKKLAAGGTGAVYLFDLTASK